MLLVFFNKFANVVFLSNMLNLVPADDNMTDAVGLFLLFRHHPNIFFFA